MTNTEQTTEERIFKRLDWWRHLPHFSFEPRMTPFFEIFLIDLLRERFSGCIHSVILPEFPLHKQTIDANEIGNQCWHVDYVAFALKQTEITPIFIELKTDMSSIKHDQIKYLKKARNTRFEFLVEAIKTLAMNENTDGQTKKKYVHLLHHLSSEGLNLVSLSDEIYGKLGRTEKNKPHWSDVLKDCHFHFEKKRIKPTKIVYIQPKQRSSDDREVFRYIYFDEIVKTVRNSGNLGRVFAYYLERWKKDAGSLDPRKLATYSPELNCVTS